MKLDGVKNYINNQDNFAIPPAAYWNKYFLSELKNHFEKAGVTAKELENKTEKAQHCINKYFFNTFDTLGNFNL